MHTSSDFPLEENQVQSLATILLALNPSAAFHPSIMAGTRGTTMGTPRAVVSMNMIERFGRLVKSNANQLLGKMEDPEKVLEQAVVDMQKDLVKVRQAYAEVSASTKRLESQISAAEEDAAKWYDRAQLALNKGDEELAKEALNRRQQQLQTADSLKDQAEVQQNSVQSLFESMQDLEAKMAEAKAKKDQIIARARTAKAATKVNDMLAGVGTSSSVAAFDRMSEKVEQLEAEADVSKTLALSSPGGSLKSSSMEDKFLQLEAKGSVDDELEQMKKALAVKSEGSDDKKEEKKELTPEEKMKKLQDEVDKGL